VAKCDHANPMRGLRIGGNELALRVASAVVLVPLAIGAAYLGGWSFVVFWAVAAIGVLWEWVSLVAGSDRRSVLASAQISLALAIALVAAGYHLSGAIVLAAGTLAAWGLAPSGRRYWVAAGVPYAAALGIAPVVLRSDPDAGFPVIVLLFAVVWTTDVVAYFVGRALGGPKLMPRVSPKKTWSGAVGGTVAAAMAALVAAKVLALSGLFAVTLVAALLSVAGQLGDLFESFLKRRFGVKDSSGLIPGHGGLMDRLDGFVSAAVLAALIGVARGGIDAPGRGLLMW
jgi:phosphatidate cytidylyltransferase